MTTTELCPEATLTDLIAAIQRDPDTGLDRVEQAVSSYPADGRLQFLHGSMLATAKRYDEARDSMTRAVEVAPYFWIARFQLGLLQLTSGDPQSAVITWRPLHELPQEHALATFATGLEALIGDELAEAARLLELGIERNVENPPLNRDMRMMIERISALTSDAPAETPQSTSAVQMILQQYEGKGTKH